MSSPHGHPLAPSRRQSTTARDEDSDLTLSLKQLSLSTNSVPASPRFGKATSPLQPPSRRSSPSPGRRTSSRSPSGGHPSRDTSPSLVRKASTNSLRSANGGLPLQSSSRRSSFAQTMSPKLKPANAGFPPDIQEKPPLTAEMVAKEFFEAELQSHHGLAPLQNTDTVVILNDAVYGHRFSRPRTSRNALSTIVERPERIKAAVLGISAAYVRLGERHCDGAYPVSPDVDVAALPSVPFRIHKTDRKVPLLSQAVSNVHGTKWMEELKMMCDSAEAKLAMGGKELSRPDMSRSPDQPRPEKLHEGDLYLCSESRDAMEGALGAVCEAVDLAFGSGPRRAFVGVRPPGHHCSASHPSGFCWVNNVHVGIMHGALDHGLTHAAIIDFDLHHGDGSQDITWQHNSRSIAANKNAASWKKTSIGYFSIHDINSYPCEMGDEEKVKNASLCIDNAHGQTVWNVHLQSWNSEAEFWQLYESKYTTLLEKTRSYLRNQTQRLRAANQKPKAAIFISAGFDASEWESAGMQRHQVNVPTEFYARITQDIIKLAAEEGLGTDGRVISVLEGGYSDRALCSGILSHVSGLVSNQTPHKATDLSVSAVGTNQTNDAAHAISPPTHEANKYASVHTYDPSWWASSELEKLENGEASAPSPPKAKSRNALAASYSSPTQASVARAVDPVKARRSFSGHSGTPVQVIPRLPTPPPPEVPWTIAALELSKLLIPSTRQTDSCKAEDLNAEATRVRRERQSMLAGIPVANSEPVPERPTSKMSLRERRSRPASRVEDRIAEQASKNRRKTVAVTALPVEKATASSVPADSSSAQADRRASRRLSGSAALLRTTSDTAIPLQMKAESLPGETPAVPPAVPAGKTANARAPVKKTRAPVAARRGPATKTQPAKQKATTPGSAKPGSTSSGDAAAGPQSSSSSPRGAVDDLEQITSGMKKIRINLITQSKKEERERARLEAEKLASSPTLAQPTEQTAASPHDEGSLQTPVSESPMALPDQSTGVEETPAHNATTEQSSSSPLREPPRDIVTPVQEGFSSNVVSPELPQNQPRSPRTVPFLAVQPSSDPADVFIPYQPDGPAPVAVSQPEALKWLPPNASMSAATTPAATPSPVKRQDKLFHYTTGIPFAPRSQGASPVKPGTTAPQNLEKVENVNAGQSGSIWDIAETPHKESDDSK
ncbi:Histone deacetylase HOS3 [Paramyrothecium foliicola]|nr:Histone deacetylase HOS3 [Paramyrothecium foliicola]